MSSQVGLPYKVILPERIKVSKLNETVIKFFKIENNAVLGNFEISQEFNYVF